MSVSLVENECPKNKPSNNLRVFYQTQENEEKQGFAVCSKGLSQLEDVSLKIIEWIELLRSLGVDKISLHILAVHPNVMKVKTICFKVFGSVRSSGSQSVRQSVHHKWDKFVQSTESSSFSHRSVSDLSQREHSDYWEGPQKA